MKYLSILALIALLLLSCGGRKSDDISVQKLVVNSEIDELSDSTFFKEMMSLVFKDGKLYCAEINRSQVLVLDEEMKLINTIGSLGQGPRDLIHISYITVYKDTVIVNDGNARMQLFHSDGKHIGSEKTFYETSFLPFYRFVYRDNSYIGDAKDSAENAHVFCNNNDGTVRYFGERYKFANSTQERIRNYRYLLDGDKYLISISDNMPRIEKYDYETLRLISTFDLSSIEPIKSKMREIDKDNSSDNSYTFYLKDCNIFDDKVYLLCNMKTDRYYINNVIVLDCKEDFKVIARYILPENIYTSIAVSEKYLYAFSYDQCKLQRFKL